MARHDCVTLSPGGLVSIMEPNGVYNGPIDPNLIPTQQGDGEDFYPLGVVEIGSVLVGMAMSK